MLQALGKRCLALVVRTCDICWVKSAKIEFLHFKPSDMEYLWNIIALGFLCLCFGICVTRLCQNSRSSLLANEYIDNKDFNYPYTESSISLSQNVPASAYLGNYRSQSAAAKLTGKDTNLEFWMKQIGSGLTILMEEAGYDYISQHKSLDFCSRYVVPFLGPSPVDSRPRNWKSFMTDDFSPFEYSWSWESTPKIRFSFEPIGTNAGSAADYFNRSRPLECVDVLRSSLRKSNWLWFDSIANSFYKKEIGAGLAPATSGDSSSPSSIFLALEIGQQEITAKAYFVPVKAEQMGRTRLSVLADTIHGLEHGRGEISAYKLFEEYAQLQETRSPFHIVGVAVDCVDPTVSKLKIYARSQATSFNSICSTLRLGDKVSSWNGEALAELRELWQLVLSLESTYPDSQEVDCVEHKTSGVLYNFDVKANNALPETKIYIPVKHYGKTDRAISQGLATFLERRGKDQHVTAYLKAIERLSSYRQLDDGCGMQTYVSCSVKQGNLALTSYISPEIHHLGRWSLKRESV